MLDLDDQEICDAFGCYSSQDGEEQTFASMIVGGVAGLAAGALLARRPISHASATAVNYGALWGTWFGAATGVLTDRDDHEDGVLLTSLVGGNLGLAGAVMGAPRLQWSRNRYRLVSIAGVMGGLGGVGVYLIVTGESEKMASRGVAVGGPPSRPGLGQPRYAERP